MEELMPGTSVPKLQVVPVTECQAQEIVAVNTVMELRICFKQDLATLQQTGSIIGHFLTYWRSGSVPDFTEREKEI